MATFITFGLGNLIGVVFLVVFNLIFIPKMRGKTNKDKLKPLIFVWLLLIVLEILKISYHVHFYNGFSPSIYPILYCSLPFYLLPILFCSKEDSTLYRASYLTLIIPFFVIGVVLLLIYPDRTEITEQGVLLNFHSRFYHMVLLGVSIYLCHMKCEKIKLKDFLFAGTISAGYMVFSGFLSILIGGEVSFFSPFGTELGFLFKAFGYFPGLIILCVVVYIVCFLFYGIFSLINKKRRRTGIILMLKGER